MALARTDLLQQITATSGNFGTGNFTTSSFTPPSNSLLVVAEAYVENSGSTTDPASALTISGGGWTYSSPASISSSPTSFPTTVKIWTAPVGTAASMTLTLGAGGRSASFYAVSVVAYTGYDTGTSTGAVASGQQNGGFSGPPTPASITLGAAPSSTSEVFAAVAMDKTVLGVTPGSSPTVWTEVHDNMENTDWGGLETEIRSGNASTSVSWDDLRSGGGALFNFAAAAVEIRAAVSTVVFPPGQPVRRRVPTVRARPHVSAPVQTSSPPPVNTARRSRMVRGLWPRRGRIATPVPAQVVVTAPAYPPQPARVRVRGLRLFRSRSAGPVPPQVVVPPPAYPLPSVRPRLRGLRPFRPRVAAPVPAQVVVAAPTYPVRQPGPRARMLRLVRGRSASPPPVQPVPARPAQRPRLRLPRIFRGRPAATPVVQPFPPAAVHPRPRGMMPRRSRTATPVPPQVIIVPPAYPPVFSRMKRRILGLIRGRASTPVGNACDCETHRPNAGITLRPGPGITVRPDGGTTSRPCTCQGG